jgi:signal transduction histidine kinase
LLHVEEIRTFLQRIAEDVRDLFGFRLVSVSILDDERGLFTDHAMAGYTADEMNAVKTHPESFSRESIMADFRDDCGVSRIAYFIPVEKHGSPVDAFVAVGDEEAARRPRKAPDAWHELDLLYFALLNRRGDVIGYMQADYPLDGKIPSRQTVEEIELFAGIAAVGIENSKMYRRTLDLLEENEVKASRILRLLELVQSVLRIDDLDTVLQKVSDVMAGTFSFRKGGVSIFTEGSEKVVIHSLTGYSPEEMKEVMEGTIWKNKVLEDFKEEFRVTRTGYFIPGEIQGDGSGFIFMESPDNARVPRKSPDSWHELDLLYFALYDREGKMLGFIQLDYPEDSKIPTKETMEAMEAFATIAAIAIENSAMYKDMSIAQDQVRMYLDLLSHDVGNLVNPVNAYLEIVLGTTSITPIQYKYLSSALEASRSMLHIIRNVRRSAQMLETKGVELVPVNLTRSLRQSSAEARGGFLGKKVKINLNVPEQDLWVVADNFLDEVLYNLITNSIKYDEHEEVLIDVEAKPAELEGKNYINIRVVDRGVGIPDDLKDKIFTREFRKIRQERISPQKPKGAGMGLSIVKSLVDRYHGKIWVENRVYEDYTRGSVFNLLIPTP